MLYNINLMIYQIFRGLGVGVSVHVGNTIGRKCDYRSTGGALQDFASEDSDDEEKTKQKCCGNCCGKGRQSDGVPLNETLVAAAAKDAKLYCWTG